METKKDPIRMMKLKKKRDTAHIPGKEPFYYFHKTTKWRILKDGTRQGYYYWELRRNWRDPDNWKKRYNSTEKHLGPADSIQTTPNEKQRKEAYNHLRIKYGLSKVTINDIFDDLKKIDEG